MLNCLLRYVFRMLLRLGCPSSRGRLRRRSSFGAGVVCGGWDRSGGDFAGFVFRFLYFGGECVLYSLVVGAFGR